MVLPRFPRHVMHEHVPDRRVYCHIAVRHCMSKYISSAYALGQWAETRVNMSRHVRVQWVNERSRVVDAV